MNPEWLSNLWEALKKRLSTRLAILIGTGCLIAFLLVAGFYISHAVRSNYGASRASKRTNASTPTTTSTGHSDGGAQSEASGSKSSPSSITVIGTIQPGFATCDVHAKQLLAIVSGKKLLYVVEADDQLRTQLQSPRTLGRPVQVRGTVSGTQTVCSYGKSRSTPVLKVAELQPF